MSSSSAARRVSSPNNSASWVCVGLLFLAACGDAPTGVSGYSNNAGIIRIQTATGTDSTTGATLETDQDDYFPGDSVQIVGTGWAPGETVGFHLTRQPQTSADNDWTVTADASGGFTTGFLVVETDLGVTFTLTGTGPTSGSVATVVFTDAVPITSVTLDPAPGEAVAPESDIEFTVTGNVTFGGVNILASIGVTAYLDGTLPGSASPLAASISIRTLFSSRPGAPLSSRLSH